MRQRAIRQRELFHEPEGDTRVQLAAEVRQELRRLLVLWMQALARAISEEAVNEQDQR
ncbi:MAG: hypothetical protein WCF44_04715 [Candidatus Methylophosphatis roskildensis]